jgi:hypothetical protein
MSDPFPYRSLSLHILSHLYEKIDHISDHDLPYFTEVMSGAYQLISSKYSPTQEGSAQQQPNREEGEIVQDPIDPVQILTLGVLATHFLKNEIHDAPVNQLHPSNG